MTNIFCIVDWNKSAKQLMQIENLRQRWESFGWETSLCNGHSNNEFNEYFNKKLKKNLKKPQVLILNTIKGKGVPFMEGHGSWHHKIPNQIEYDQIMKFLE